MPASGAPRAAGVPVRPCVSRGLAHLPTKEGQTYCYDVDDEGKVERDCCREMRLTFSESGGDWTKVLQGRPAD
jgi:hypothetical protein